MTTEFVTKELCAARSEKRDLLLEQILKNSDDAKKGVGNLNRRLFEGNGVVALDLQISRNTDHRKRVEKVEEKEQDAKRSQRFQWLLSTSGWGVAFAIGLIVVLVEVYVR